MRNITLVSNFVLNLICLTAMLIGVAIVTIAGFLGISLGITSAIIRLASQTTNTSTTIERTEAIQQPFLDGSKDDS